MEKIKRLALFLTGFLLIGSAISWSTVVLAFTRFYENEGTIFKFNNCVFPNPATTPCFYGAIAFLICLAWSVYLYRKQARGNPAAGYSKLMWLLFASTLFGWGNVAYEIYQFSQNPKGIVGCSAKVITSPFQSPCLYGSIMFLLSLIAAYIIVQKFKSRHE